MGWTLANVLSIWTFPLTAQISRCSFFRPLKWMRPQSRCSWKQPKDFHNLSQNLNRAQKIWLSMHPSIKTKNQPSCFHPLTLTQFLLLSLKTSLHLTSLTLRTTSPPGKPLFPERSFKIIFHFITASSVLLQLKKWCFRNVIVHCLL